MGQRRVAVGVASALLATSVLAVPPAASSAAPAAPQKEVSEAPQVSPRSSSKVWLFDSPQRAVTRAAAGAAPSVPKGTGPVRNGTLVSFSLADRMEVKVNVGSGNLMVNTTDLTLPGIAGNVTLGASFNSLMLGSDLSTGAHGPGWRTRAGQDVKLYPADDSSVTYAAADGVVGKFTWTGSAYTTPGEFKAKLVKNGTGWKLTENDSGKELFFTSDGLLDKTEDRNDNVTDYTYSGGQLTQVVSDRGSQYARKATATFVNGRLKTYEQSDAYNVIRTVSYKYDANNRLQAIDLLGATRQWAFEYSAAGDLVKIWSKDDLYSVVTYDGQHRVTSFTQVTDTTTGQGATTRLSYPTSSQTMMADPRQDLAQPVASVPHTTYDLNSDKRVTKATDPAGNERSKTYTTFQDVATDVSPEGSTTTNTYGANAGQSLTKSASPSGASASAAYANAATSTNPTANFQPSSSIDTQSNSSTYTYNGAGNRTSTADALAAKADVDYNTDGTVKTSTDPANTGNPTTYTYDSDKQITTLTPPTGNGLAVKTFTYDVLGRTRTVAQGGCTTTYDWTKDDRLEKTSYSGCGANLTPVTYEYGRAGNLQSRTDATGTTTWEWDNLNQLRKRTNPGGVTLLYDHDLAGNLTGITDGRGTTKHIYNTRNWLVGTETASGTRYNYSYDKDGNRLNTFFAANVNNSVYALRVKTTYDKSDRPTRITATRNSAAPATVFDVTYCYAKYTSGQPCSTATTDDTGLRQWQKDETSGTVSQFTYDKANRLTKATNYNGKTYDYTYTKNGNRDTVKVDGTTTQTLTFNTANQITTTNNTYDNRGNQTRASAPSVNPITYNNANQMTGANSSTYAYAGTDQVELTRAGTTTMQYGYEDQHGMPWLQSWTAGGTTVYVERDGLGTPLGLRINGTDTAFVLDGLGTPVAAVKANGTLAATYKYDPYGNATTTDETNLGTNNIVRYAGGTYDQATGFTKFGQRWFNPQQGRFTQQDNLSFVGNPLHGNRYAYAACNPANYTDPTGRCSTSSILGFASGAVAGFGAAYGTWAMAGVVFVPFVGGAVLVGTGAVAGVLALAGLGFCLAGD
ncbi:RHS repeat-associated core domain-containing protein [Micromonospora sp. WMMD980]|uniref:RHS repeat domain-containing protein n=1 Tax=Micromonospora sp. WMMD980 TaxID=3016088 RepID=UPI002416ACCE|nr:RHS repeat-associated core domain-containing protein [Micromonospora sp. WMMD980]MDG4802084.1 RHS repeat-associated core domain-containing protein [Micromonospora sp. WMMD980]